MHYIVSINPHKGGRVLRVRRSHLYLPLLAVVVAVSTLVTTDYRSNAYTLLAESNPYHSMVSTVPAKDRELKEYMAAHAELRWAIDRDRDRINSMIRQADHKVGAISMRLSALQGRIVRMEAIGKHIADMAGLKPDEFDLESPAGLGGPAGADSISGSYSDQQLAEDISIMESRLANNIDKLLALESLLMNKHMQALTMPTGSPVPGGWLTSSYGTRNDPFTGRREFHRGIDIAAKKGSKVVAAAPGMVIFSGYRVGYGNMVEIKHAEDFVTRYGHNSKNLVIVGETVQKGQDIAIIGSTGRSTGLHVHFEVLKSGVPVNPRKFTLLK